MDIVLITRDRPELTEQCIRSMRENANDWSKHRLAVLFDGTVEELRSWAPVASDLRNVHSALYGGRCHYLGITGVQRGVGGAKNAGAEALQGIAGALDHPHFGAPKGLLMFSDNDMWYGPGWDRTFEVCIDADLAGRDSTTITQLGGWRHPFHQPTWQWKQRDPITHKPSSEGILEVDAVTGNCFVIRWSDWLKYGPFDANAIGPGQSEDFALSQRIKAGGGIVATLDPPVAIHCGLVNSSGEPATGWQEMEQQITGQLAALPEAMRDEVLIMRPAPTHGQIPVISGRALFVAPNRERMTIERISVETDQPKDGEYQYRHYRCTTCNTPMYWSGEPGCVHVCLNCHPDQSPDVAAKPEKGADQLNNAAVEMGLMEPSTSYHGVRLTDMRLVGLNVGSGQRRFESTREVRWTNVDLVSRKPDQVPDLIADARELHRYFDGSSVDYVVSHHLHEHLGHGEADPITQAAYAVLKPGGSLLVFTPDARKLAGRWLSGELDDFQFAVQLMGAYQGLESDRHRWLYTQRTLAESLANAAPWREVKAFDWREISGMNAAGDWYIAAVECVK